MKKQIIILTLLCLTAVSCEKKGPRDESEEKYEGSGLLEHEVKEGDTNPPYIETFSDKLRGIYIYNTYETLVESSFYCSKTNKVYKPHELEYGKDINFSISINTVTIKDSCFINELVITKAIASDIEVPLKVNPMPTSILEGRNYIEKYPYISNKTELQECLYNNTDYSMTKSLVIKKEDFKGEHYFFFIAGSDSPKRGLISIKDIRTERIDWKNLNGENIYFTISSMVEK